MRQAAYRAQPGVAPRKSFRSRSVTNCVHWGVSHPREWCPGRSARARAEPLNFLRIPAMGAGERVARISHMRPHMPRLLLAAFAAAALLVPATASAVTVEEIVALSRAG